MSEHDNDLDAARGIGLGILMALILWAIVFGCGYGAIVFIEWMWPI